LTIFIQNKLIFGKIFKKILININYIYDDLFPQLF
jgi:hypothetical protein